jgi:DNA ligase (NAD+)
VFFAEERNRDVLDRLLKAGVSPQPLAKAGSSLAGKTFVLTGALDAWTREEATEETERRGGRVTSGVSSETDYVVVGEDLGSKLEDAKSEGVKMIDQAEFRWMLD